MEEFKFKIHGVEQTKQYNGMDNVILSIHFSYYLILDTEERKAARSLNRFLDLDIPQTSEGFIPIENIDANTLIGWISDKLDIPAMQERLRVLINQEILPTFNQMIEGINKLNQP
jgi:hypothetical protein